jgi:photosystem II stability/assembly factor-like uncharacterized protein
MSRTPFRLGCLLVLVTVVPAAPGRAQDWTIIPTGTMADILAVENTAFAEKWIVGTGGFAAQSSLGRTVWTTVSVGTASDLHSVVQPSSGQVWVGAGQGTVRLKSGTEWLNRNIPNGAEDFILFSRNSGGAYAVGGAGGIHRTADGGLNWTAQSSGTSAALHGGSGFISSTAYVVGDAGTILKTTNGGMDWFPLPSGTSSDLHALIEAPATWLTVVGEAGTVLQSTDGGVSWIPRLSGVSATLRAVSRSGQNANWLVAVGLGGTMIRSTDGGVNWCILGTGTGADLFGVEAVTNSEYIVVGAGGLLMRTTNGGGSCYAPSGVTLPVAGAACRLAGPEPNPLSGHGIIELEVARAQEVRAALFDPLGRRVGNIFQGFVEGGAPRSLRLDARPWAPGVYFLRLSGETFSASRRIVVVR